MFQKETPDPHLHSGRRLILWWGSLKWGGGALNWYWMLRPWVSFVPLTLRGTTEKSLWNRPAHEEKTCYWHITPAKKEHLGTKRKFWEIESVIAGKKKKKLNWKRREGNQRNSRPFPRAGGLVFPDGSVGTMSENCSRTKHTAMNVAMPRCMGEPTSF